mgnify:CR=1 FL=1
MGKCEEIYRQKNKERGKTQKRKSEKEMSVSDTEYEAVVETEFRFREVNGGVYVHVPWSRVKS